MGAAAAQAEDHLATVLNRHASRAFPNSAATSASDRRSPSSVRTTDFAFVDRVPDQALAMEPDERDPVEALPRSLPVMERQAEQRQDGIVDLVLIDLHAPNAMPPWSPMSTLFAAAPAKGYDQGVGVGL